MSRYAYHSTHIGARVSERAYQSARITARMSEHAYHSTHIRVRISEGQPQPLGFRCAWKGRPPPSLPPVDLPVVAMPVALACSAPVASGQRAVHAGAKGAALLVPRCRSRSAGGAREGRVARRDGLQRSIDWTLGYVLQQQHQWPTCTWTEDALRDFRTRSTGMDATDPLDLWRTATATVTAPGAAPRR